MSTSLFWQQQVKARRSRRVVWISVALLCTVIFWAHWAELDEVIIGEGRVVPASAVQQIQSLEGGILTELHVRSGDLVEKGQLLATLDNTYSKAAWQEGVQQSDALKMLIVRSQAELQSIQIDADHKDWRERVKIIDVEVDSGAFSEKRAQTIIENYHERLSQLRSLLTLEKQEIEQAIQAFNEAKSRSRTLSESVKLSQQEIRLTEISVQKGAVSEIELLQLKREQIRMQGELSSSRLNEKRLQAAYQGAITDTVNLARDFRAKIRTQLTDARNQLAQLNESQPALADRLQRAALYSPLQGRVKDIARRTLGGVIKPGESIMEVVPDSEKMIIETRIQPKDIAYLSMGLEAMVKFTAYDFVIYGGEKGVVTYISADALQDEEGGTYYQVNIETQQTQTSFEIIPGMQASVDIKTGKKSVLNYWLKPLLRARANALREP
ncbi:HlyD family type I secretion periplasmic adaptor subunit [Psychromonas sp. psych-6C06]|uniref:HlyD family type I secretion periplasmic adaptor subunit n=1 Tax=Psychromonas sp. psych-6C06 TaxID=2058089 RepID=UPI000C338DA0|nr:HlyD family type I secretion periplasmic adaptor subunit [Psychromonas sp. psych-6C06]PKF61250.1 HlyD family type I secretion periplasmic adaptor subunit [Psychromonas sp. psych-6C06]